MFAVLFEVRPKPERWDEYLAHAAALRVELAKIDGFLDNRRFRGQRRPGWLLSLSLWRDEPSLIRWRGQADHRASQQAGRREIFEDYRIRVGPIGPTIGQDAAVTVIEAPSADPPPDAPGLVDWDRFDGMVDPLDRAMLISWRDADAMAAATGLGGGRRLDIAVRRDYGMRARAQAPTDGG